MPGRGKLHDSMRTVRAIIMDKTTDFVFMVFPPRIKNLAQFQISRKSRYPKIGILKTLISFGENAIGHGRCKPDSGIGHQPFFLETVSQLPGTRINIRPEFNNEVQQIASYRIFLTLNFLSYDPVNSGFMLSDLGA